MSSVRNLPEEVLLMIFSGLQKSDLNQCQRVCRSWYKIAHLQFLQSIVLEGTTQIEQFIRSIDNNKNPSYLNAVKKINIDKKKTSIFAKAEEEPHLDRAAIRKLLFRFPNLTDIQLWDTPFIYEPLDPKLCNELLKKCPKLSSFEVSSEANILHKFRKLVTEVRLYDAYYAEDYGGITKFLCGFPRLTSINCHIKKYDTFGKLLPVFEKLPNITNVNIAEALYDTPYFGDVYISKKKQDKQDLLIKRLSNVTNLSVCYKEGFCENSMAFICKYFTGVKNFRMLCFDNYVWSDSETEVFCKNILDFACSLQVDDIECGQMGFETLSRCLPTVLQKVLDQDTPVNKKRTLRFVLQKNHFSPVDTVELSMSGSSRYVNIKASTELNINQITSDVFGSCATINAVDEFILCYYSRDLYSGSSDKNSEYASELLDLLCGESKPKAVVNVEFFEKILQQMTCLKEVRLDVPPSFRESSSVTCKTKHPLVKKLTLQLSEDGQYQSMLNWCFSAFPNMKWLNLYLSSGIWNESIGQFQVHLPKYTLDKLTIDMTSVRKKTIKHLEKQGSGEDFFVLDVESITNSERQLYKISMDFSISTSIKEIDLKGSFLGEDYLRVNVIIRSVESIELLMVHKKDETPCIPYLNPQDAKRITLQIK